MEAAAKLKTGDPLRTRETQQRQQSQACNTEDKKLQSTKKFHYTFSTQPLETDLKKLLIQVTGETDLPGITEVKLKVVSGQAGLHRLSDFTPHLRILTLDGSCIASFRDLGSSLKSLTVLSVARCNMKHLDGVSGFRNLEELNARENFISDPSPCSSVRKLSKLDLSGNEVTDVSYFAFLRSCRKLRELRVAENKFSDYKEEMRTLLPRLRILDGEEFEDRIQPDAAPEEGSRCILNREDLTSEDGSSTSLSSSVENIDLEETQPAGDDLDTEDDGGNFLFKRSENDSNPVQNGPKTPQEAEEGEEEPKKEREKTAFRPHPSIGDSAAPNNGAVAKTVIPTTHSCGCTRSCLTAANNSSLEDSCRKRSFLLSPGSADFFSNSISRR